MDGGVALGGTDGNCELAGTGNDVGEAYCGGSLVQLDCKVYGW